MEDRRGLLLTRVMRFGHVHGPHTRLHSGLLDHQPASGLSFIWRNIIERADDEVLEDILSALKQGDEYRNVILVSAICSGWDGMTSPLSKDKKLKRTARRFAYHCIATIDSAVPAGTKGNKPEILNQRDYAPLILNMQQSYKWLTPPSRVKPKGRLTEEESLLANVYCLVKAHSKRNLDDKVLQTIADNFDELKKYTGYIAAMESVSMDSIEKLLGTKPELALAEGAL